MNWLEAIFHHAPDGGDGSAETLLLLVVFAGVVARLAGLRRHRAAEPLAGSNPHAGRIPGGPNGDEALAFRGVA